MGQPYGVSCAAGLLHGIAIDIDETEENFCELQ